MTVRIAVAGGTGLIGRMVVEAVRSGGGTPVVLARSTGVDLTTGAGLDAGLEGAAIVIDVSNIVATGRRRSVAFFEAATANLLAAGKRAGVAHHVVLSIIGVDRVGYGYYQGKLRQEELALGGGVPATVLRATQFHEFAGQMLSRGGPLVLAPRLLSQPIAAREVATALVEIAGQAPAGLAPELAGPRREDMAAMVRRVAEANGRRRPILTVRIPGAAGRAMADGGLLPTADGPRGTQTFEQWLATDAAKL